MRRSYRMNLDSQLSRRMTRCPDPESAMSSSTMTDFSCAIWPMNWWFLSHNRSIGRCLPALTMA